MSSSFIFELVNIVVVIGLVAAVVSGVAIGGLLAITVVSQVI